MSAQDQQPSKQSGEQQSTRQSAQPSEQLRYPMMRYGMDHDRYDWSMLTQRPAVQWPDGKLVALWVNVGLQFFPMNPGAKIKVPGSMSMPYPDLRHFTLRDYGNRVGIYRFLEIGLGEIDEGSQRPFRRAAGADPSRRTFLVCLNDLFERRLSGSEIGSDEGPLAPVWLYLICTRG